MIRVTRVRDRVVRWAGSARLASSGVSHLPDSCEANGYKWSFKALDMERLDRVAKRPTVRLTHYGRHKSGKPHQVLLGWWWGHCPLVAQFSGFIRSGTDRKKLLDCAKRCAVHFFAAIE